MVEMVKQRVANMYVHLVHLSEHDYNSALSSSSRCSAMSYALFLKMFGGSVE